MKPRMSQSDDPQQDLYRIELLSVIDTAHPLAKRAGQIRWEAFEERLSPLYDGHIKSDGRLERNHLKGRQGDRMNALLSGCGQNLRLMLNCIFFPLFLFLLPLFIPQACLRLNTLCPGVSPGTTITRRVSNVLMIFGHHAYDVVILVAGWGHPATAVDVPPTQNNIPKMVASHLKPKREQAPALQI